MSTELILTGMEPVVETPLMKQYYSIKAKHPDALLLFRVGDFYETFGKDAVKASEILGITLTKRANGAASFVDLAGFPFHAIDTYLPKLVRAGQRVAICEQLEDPRLTKKIVKRGITELITPGVTFHDNVLEHKENNFVASVHLDYNMAGVSFLDISTGEFLTTEGNYEYIDKLLGSFAPKEILIERDKSKKFADIFGNRYFTYKLDDWVFTEDSARDKLFRHFDVASLKGFGINNMKLAVIAAGAILQYLNITCHHHVSHISTLQRIEEDQYVWLDRFTMRNLELFQPLNDGGKSLLDVLDKTISPMGGRLLRRWLSLPLKSIPAINERLNVVGCFKENVEERMLFEKQITLIGDLERIVSKVATGRATPRDVLQLKQSLIAITAIHKLGGASGESSVRKTTSQLNLCESICQKIETELQPDPPAQLIKGGVIRPGISDELDKLRKILYSGKDYLIGLQQRESERTGIPSLKVSFNNVFGYYIEVRNTHKEKVPTDWIRKQTLVSAERYITDELKEYETKILGAEERIVDLETRLFNDLVGAIQEFIVPLQANAVIIARLDCLISFAKVAAMYGFNRPVINDSDILDIHEGRHPVIERMLPPGQEYVPNDVFLDTTSQQIGIITGPNMSGKSALLRQTALIVLMAQTGCFVPVLSATIGFTDKIFTRVGASDNLSMGESTFMVEMTETASILNNLSPRSLVLLDEIGRGTSTYDGISIAWAMVEFLHDHGRARVKTLFATHYHELNEMEGSFDRVKNFNVSIKELPDKVIFLRKLQPGGSEHSFGIHVARMAGMPKSVVLRANEILVELEKSHARKSLTKPVADLAEKREGYQLSIFQLEDPVLKQIRDEIRNLDIDHLTPLEALNKLNGIKRITGL